MITQAELKLRLHYDPETGFFTYLTCRKSTRIGERAGRAQVKGYRIITLNKKTYLEHRLAWFYVYGEFPYPQLDHANGVRDDNRLCNLRIATERENQFNRKISSRNKTGFKGVHFNKKLGKWGVCASLDGVRNNLGTFCTPELAAQAYLAFAREHHGDFFCDKVVGKA